MPRLLPILCLLFTAPLAVGTTAAPIAGEAEPEAIFTRQRSFAIPFRVQRPEISSQAAAEVQLHVSADQGVTWRPQSTTSPDDDRFTFEAPRDGEYWFFVRTRGEVGGLYPEQPPRPELRVIVDTIVPTVELIGERRSTGEITVRWRILDRHLVPEQFKLEYQPLGATDGWRPVDVPRQRLIGTGRVLQGETTWLPQDAPSTLLLRAEAIDRAGNAGVSEIRVERHAAALPNPAATGTPGVNLSNSNQYDDAADRAWPSQATQNLPGTGRYGGAEELLPPPMSQRFPGGRPNDGRSNNPRRNGPSAQVVRLPDSSAAGGTPEEIPLGTPSDQPAGPRWPDQYQVDSGTPDADEEAEVLPGGISQPDGNRARRPYHGGRVLNDESSFGLDMIPIGQRPRIVNTRRFELEYEIESLGPSGLSKVELWSTRDGGRTWESYGEDADRQSPMLVTVDKEGIYGFRIIAQSNSGLGGLAPRSGDLPEVWIGVDFTKPEARLGKIEFGNDDQRGGEMIIPWTVRDLMLVERPISLAYGDRMDGPWTPIASGIDNTGRYVWRLDNTVPNRVFLRLEARDEAGNVAIAVTDEPISIDRLRPQGRIRDVRPVPESADAESSTGLLR